MTLRLTPTRAVESAGIQSEMADRIATELRALGATARAAL